MEKISVNELLRKLKEKGVKQTEVTYNCDICKDRGFVTDDEGRVGNCICEIKRLQAQQIEKSGLGKAFRKRTLDSMEITNDSLKKAMETVKDYVANSTSENLIISGAVGGGKTHLAIGTLLEFVKQGKSIRYTGYRELVNSIKALAMDIEGRNREMGKFKSPQILLIDDLFKRSQTEPDIALIYELINHRYLEGTRTIITTEKTLSELDMIDEAIASRLFENSGQYMISLDTENYRYKGV